MSAAPPKRRRMMYFVRAVVADDGSVTDILEMFAAPRPSDSSSSGGAAAAAAAAGWKRVEAAANNAPDSSPPPTSSPTSPPTTASPAAPAAAPAAGDAANVVEAASSDNSALLSTNARTRWQYRILDGVLNDFAQDRSTLLLVLDAANNGRVACITDGVVALNVGSMTSVCDRARVVVRKADGTYRKVIVNDEDGPLPLDIVPVEIKVGFIERSEQCEGGAEMLNVYMADALQLANLEPLRREIARLNSRPAQQFGEHLDRFRNGAGTVALPPLPAKSKPNLTNVMRRIQEGENHPLVVVETVSDGDCFYDALALAIMSVLPPNAGDRGSPEEAMERTRPLLRADLRAIVSRAVVAHGLLPQEFLGNEPDSDQVRRDLTAQYAEIIRTNKDMHADNFALLALERELRLKFFIFHNHRSQPRAVSVLANEIMAEVPLNFVAVLFDPPVRDNGTELSGHYRLLAHANGEAAFSFAGLPPMLRAAGALVQNAQHGLACVPEFASLAAQARSLQPDVIRRAQQLNLLVQQILPPQLSPPTSPPTSPVRKAKKSSVLVTPSATSQRSQKSVRFAATPVVASNQQQQQQQQQQPPPETPVSSDSNLARALFDNTPAQP